MPWANLTASAYRPASASPASRTRMIRSMKLSEYRDSSAGMVGSPKRNIRRKQRQVRDQRQPPALAPQHPDGERGAGCEGAEQDAARPLVLDDDQPDRERDRDQDVGDRDPEVGARPLVEAEQGQRVLVQGERPEAEDREPRQPGVLAIEQGLRDRAGEGQGDRGGRRSAPEQRREARRDDPLRALAGEVVEAQDRLDDAEPDDDARRDHRGEHHLGGAVVAGGQIAACRSAAGRPRSASRARWRPCTRPPSWPAGAGTRTPSGARS